MNPFYGLPVVYLHPGDIFYSVKPVLVTTVLGSCLSITMFSRKKKFGGISHCQLPTFERDNGKCTSCSTPYKYVDCTISKMLEKFEEHMIPRHEIEIKIFGGADVIGRNQHGVKTNTIGNQNIVSAVQLFNRLELNISVSDTGGKTGRKIFFITNSGDIYLKRLKSYEKD